MKEELARGDFVRLAYRLGRARATGVVTIALPRARPELLVLRRGHLITGDPSSAHARLGRLASLEGAAWSFDGGTAAYPPGALGRQLALAPWARAHLESQLDHVRAERLVSELAGARLSLRPELAPDPVDETDRRLLAAMTQPRRLDQIWPLARTPRFRLLAFVHFLRAVGALQVTGVARIESPRVAAMRLLGLDGDPSREAVRRAYHRLARALHPDLQPGISELRRRELESKLAEVTAAYQALCA